VIGEDDGGGRRGGISRRNRMKKGRRKMEVRGKEWRGESRIKR
jgi:hypothetical protein